MNTGEQNQRHAFISYVHEDKARVDRLQEALEAAGVSVWRDTKDLWPGQNWEDKIRAAIKSDSLAFIACFSERSAAREKSYQNAELALAADEYRLRPPATEWLVPVRFSECAVPDFNLGAGRTLGSLHRVDLFGESEMIQTVRLVQAVQRIVSPVATTTPAVISPAVVEGLAEQRQADSPRHVRSQEIKALLRDPNGDIMLEDVAMDIVRAVRKEVNDPEKFPPTLPSQEAVAATKFVIQQIHAYEKALEPAFELMTLGAMYGLPRHEPIWTRIMQTLGAPTQQNGNPALLRLRGYPLVLSTYLASIAAISRGNYGALRAFVADPEIRDGDKRVPISLHTGSRIVVSDIEWMASALRLSSDQGKELTEELIAGLRKGSVGGRYTPISDHICGLLQPLFEDHFSSEEEYLEIFDTAEVFMDLIATDAAAARTGKYFGSRGNYGRYTWRHVHSNTPPEKVLSDTLESTGTGWSPLLGGLFGGSEERAKAAFELLLPNVQDVRRRQW